MARQSQRLSAASKASPAHKRAASNSAVPATTSKRAKKSGSSKATPTKSQYFEHETDDENDTDNESPDEPSSGEDDASEFGGEEEDEDSPPSDPSDADDYDSEDDKPKKRSAKSTPKTVATSSPAIRSKGQELWRPGVKTGLGPGNQVVIKKPKARAAGKTPYQDDTIHPNTLLFLADLKANNDRQWLKSKCTTCVFDGHLFWPSAAHWSCDATISIAFVLQLPMPSHIAGHVAMCGVPCRQN